MFCVLVCFHPELPIMLTGSEDGTVRIWHSGTYRLESSLNYGLERVWTISSLRNSNNVAIGYESLLQYYFVKMPEDQISVIEGEVVDGKLRDIQGVFKGKSRGSVLFSQKNSKLRTFRRCFFTFFFFF